MYEGGMSYTWRIHITQSRHLLRCGTYEAFMSQGLLGTLHDQVSLALQLLAVQRCDTNAFTCFVQIYSLHWLVLRPMKQISSIHIQRDLLQ